MVPVPSDKVVFWHRELPPLSAEIGGSHIVEASSVHVPGTMSRRDQLWTRCEQDLMARAHERLLEEMARLGGRYVHVVEEHIEPHRNDATGETWLAGRFGYTLYT